MQNEPEQMMGPVDYLVLEFPGSRMNGEGLPLLVDLVDRGIVRVLDLLFVSKQPDGSVVSLTGASFDDGLDSGLALFDGASSGLVGQDDLDEIAQVLEDGSSAAIVVYENTWAAPLASALVRSGAQLVASARIPVPALIAAIEAAEAASMEGDRPEELSVPDAVGVSGKG